MKKIVRSLVNGLLMLIQFILVIALNETLRDQDSLVEDKLVGTLCTLIIMFSLEYVKIDKNDLE